MCRTAFLRFPPIMKCPCHGFLSTSSSPETLFSDISKGFSSQPWKAGGWSFWHKGTQQTYSPPLVNVDSWAQDPHLALQLKAGQTSVCFCLFKPPWFNFLHFPLLMRHQFAALLLWSRWGNNNATYSKFFLNSPGPPEGPGMSKKKPPLRGRWRLPDRQSRLCLFSVSTEAFPGKGLQQNPTRIVRRSTVITICNLLTTVVEETLEARIQRDGSATTASQSSSNDPH